ncbi:MAG: heavy-metal-associated domain-containing protein [Flavobacteriaceae bacterium]|nr:heavy-metal-associated domain-containing protein [Bacteroidia bacterium]NNK83206.1 heavy-metal-associated domain-containing protein [Flavobacteriaceae bacterium]
MKTTLVIQNLKCGGCANTVTTRLSKLENISEVIVNNDEDSVTFNYTSDEDLEKAIHLLSDLGYPVDGEANTLSKKAKSFVSCAIGRMNK